MNDFLPKEKFVSAGAGLQLIFGMSAMVAPFLCSLFMKNLGPNGLFLFLFIFQLLIVIFGIYRMTIRPSKDNPENSFTTLPRNITPVGIQLDPDTPAKLEK